MDPRYSELEATRREGIYIADELAELRAKRRGSGPGEDTLPKPTSHDDRSANELRPELLTQVVGQDQVKDMLERVVISSVKRSVPLDHILLVGPAGTGKTTLANVIANETGKDCYQLAAPVSMETLMGLRAVMQEGDILFVDEIHMQAVQERRGKEAMSSPEVFLALLEDFKLMTNEGMLDFPRITVIGATTDPGRLPDPFLDRFPLQPRLDRYSARDLGLIGENSALKLGLDISSDVSYMFGKAARRTPRIVNNYIRNASAICGADRKIDEAMADEVLDKLNGTTRDGLTREMQDTLVFLFSKCRRERSDGEITYSASISTIATAIGLSRDTKAVQLRVEPYLIEEGFLQVGHGGRCLTPTGIRRAGELLDGGRA